MLTLTLQLESPIPLEVDVLRPDTLRGLAMDALKRLPIQHGNRTLQLADAFTLEGDADDECVLVRGNCSRVKHLGRGMRSGSLTIEGSAGMHSGAEMRGGTLTVTQDADAWLGAEMRGGLIRVLGHAGENVGAAYRGADKGMRGGTILIAGNAGHEVGALMRRGLIAVAGSVGSFAGINMIAGTIIGGAFGGRTGAGMKRGTIVALTEQIGLPTTFAPACIDQPVFLALYATSLRQKGFELGQPLAGRTYRRYSGDRLALGKGEVFVPVSDR